MSALKETRDLFRIHTQYTVPLTYGEWLAIPDDNKAAVLYVQFYDQISLAWHKAKSFYTPEEDAVSTVLQYLMKNVPIIASNEKKFTPNYVYRVAYNCLYCICHDYQKDKQRYENECSNLVEYGDDVLDLFDTVQDSMTAESEYFDRIDSNKFWRVVKSIAGDNLSEEDVQATVDKLINPDSALPANLRRNTAKREEVINKLRDKLAKFREEYNI